MMKNNAFLKMIEENNKKQKLEAERKRKEQEKLEKNKEDMRKKRGKVRFYIFPTIYTPAEILKIFFQIFFIFL